MKIIPQSIEDIFLVEPNIFSDERGHFFEAFRQDKFEEAVGYKVHFCQDNESKSTLFLGVDRIERGSFIKIKNGQLLNYRYHKFSTPDYIKLDDERDYFELFRKKD